ncbi:MAG: recombinase RecA [Candidatus Spechtbacteria bacterium RIFCSPLOWO2_12_FULL_38_22]|uniref:Protein RecA n=1 Tax=Candidatus Spechtbacteria bacterium RIFCSPLOWO2_12_FULL_38_22 TaxID=1802165 RepID=A0A1G2HFV6_9BACT|nr:MAG: recombinase RecA [Candidatus Spechtbacteria bacterium RIFCSPHIGHO2_12_FULL_38_30]OGZ60629.1 MAG: recombinase RecA [Candidatus Spechtbacteria bacterium RIFCSPLOWO2_01_FULL_38_20]OGZ61363.1 MAG: recombinase RecA [Candidatus Spechtbacteria bacterium RIFCSPLOWO2_12_FULL_38_22]
MTTKKDKKDKVSVRDSKDKILAIVINEIRQKFGDGAIMQMDSARKISVDTISTGSISLDIALGVGGVPRGRIIEIYGPESSGKTTLALHIVSNAQRSGGIAAFVDAEHALDPEYAKKIGVNVKDLLISQPDTGEQALDIVESLVRSNSVDVIVVDSVAALTPRAEIEGEMGDQQIGLQARLMSKALRKLTAVANQSHTVIIFINQMRMKIGVMFGNPETTTGGKALKFYSSVRIEVRQAAKIKSGEEIIGNRVNAKIVKNKVAAPFRKAEFDIYYNEGISYLSDLVNTGAKYDIVKRSGAWYHFGDIKLGQGLEGAKEFLRENPKVTNEIEKGIKKAVS